MAEIQVGGETYYYQEKGRGTPVVLVHGFPLDGRIWDAQLAGLSEKWRVIVPDLRGFGKSKSQNPFTLEALADGLHELLGKLSALPCVLAGLSMGGYVALAFVVKYAKDLKGLMLVDTKAEGDTAEGKAGRNKMIETARSAGSKAIADAMMPKMLAPDAAQSRPQLVQKLREIMEGCPALTIEHALTAMRDRPDQRDKLRSIAVPTLVVVGESDSITPVAGAEAMQREIPKSRLLVIKGAGHMSPMEQPEQVNRGVREWLEQEIKA